ncbi:hypothetical protein IC582_006684 [Cucumis melo]|uniref:Homeotic protein knotted-1-like n=2 Tax=Cucumis melo TaxID=3656 RepID=A0ABM3KKU5_CUCME|nr:homeotic protein knotted-1-like [Cucumis melo]
MEDDEYKVHGDRCRGNFLYNSVPVLATNCSSPVGNFVIRSSYSSASSSNGNNHNHHHHHMIMAAGHSNNYFPPSDQLQLPVKVEPPTTTATASSSQSHHIQLHDFHYHLMTEFQNNHINININNHNSDSIKAKILSHSLFSNILQAFLDCQNVGAPPEVAAKLTSVREEFERQRSSMATAEGSSVDPELDQFMEAYYGMLVKYREELRRPIQEAVDFMHRIESQLNTLCNGSFQILPSGREGKSEGMGSSTEEEAEKLGGEEEREIEEDQIDPRAEERELKNHLLKKYSGYLSSLKQELSKKKKKGKLPKDARQQLLRWWELHNKWPYPSEAEKLALAESTGLDQKQINNWFINQRKRHWKPSEDVQFMGMEGFYHPNAAAFYFDHGHFMADSHYRLGP